MYNLLNIYDCPKCGKVLSDEVYHGEIIDVNRDEVYDVKTCIKCKSDVTPRRVKDEETGRMIDCFEEVDDERARWANGFYDDIL
jgi:hypothetical protein